MKTIFAVLVSLCMVFHVHGAVSGTTPTGGGAGSSTNAFSTLSNLANVGIPAITNVGTNLQQRPFADSTNIHWTSPGGTNMVATVTNSGVTAGPYTFASFTVGADGRVTSASSGTFTTNDITYTAGSGVIDTVQTNNTTNWMYVSAAIFLTADITHGAKASLMVESSVGSGTFYIAGQEGIDIILDSTNSIGNFVPPSSRYYFTNQSIAGGGTATIVTNTEWRIRLFGAGGAGGGGGGSVTSVALTSDFQTVGGSPITGAGTLTLTSPYVPANSNVVASLSNGLVTISNSIVPLSNGIVVISNGLVVLSNSIPAISNGIVAVSNGVVVVSNGLVMLSNSIPPLSNALVIVSNRVVTLEAMTNGLAAKLNSFNAQQFTLTSLTNVNMAVSPIITNVHSLGTGANSTAVGTNAVASTSDAVALGSVSTASGSASIAIGNLSSATNTRDVAVGRSSSATGGSSTAVGAFANAAGASAVAVGVSANSVAQDTIAMGNAAAATANHSIAIGSSASAGGFTNAVAIGKGATATAVNQIMLGTNGITVVVPGTLNLSGAATNKVLATDATGNVITTVVSGGGGSGFPLSADADVGGFALTNLYQKSLSFTSAHSLVVGESGIAFNNIGTTSREDFTLPAPTVGVTYTFVCMDTDGLRVILPAGTSVIQLSGLTTSTGTGGGYIDTTAIGNTVTLICVSSTQWVAIAITGSGAWTTN